MEHADIQPALDGLETVTILRKPLIYGEVRQVINRLLPPLPDSSESE
jgi:hypothetical protein